MTNPTKGSPGWKVVSVQYVPDDRNWKCDVVKNGEMRMVYCYEPVVIGQEIVLARES